MEFAAYIAVPEHCSVRCTKCIEIAVLRTGVDDAAFLCLVVAVQAGAAYILK
jgi:hypothetical protein